MDFGSRFGTFGRDGTNNNHYRMTTKIMIIGAGKNISSVTVNKIQALIDRGDVEIVECTSINQFAPESMAITAAPIMPELIGYDVVKNDERRISKQGWKNRNKYKR